MAPNIKENIYESNLIQLISIFFSYHRTSTTIFPAQVDQMEVLAVEAKKKTDDYAERKKLMQ